MAACAYGKAHKLQRVPRVRKRQQRHPELKPQQTAPPAPRPRRAHARPHARGFVPRRAVYAQWRPQHRLPLCLVHLPVVKTRGQVDKIPRVRVGVRAPYPRLRVRGHKRAVAIQAHVYLAPQRLRVHALRPHRGGNARRLLRNPSNR